MIPIGPHKGKIVSHRTKMIGDKLAVSLKVEIAREQGEAVIFITDKAMGMARRALKLCGFDIDTTDLVMIDAKPTMLAGCEIPVVCEMWNGKPQLKVDLDGRAEKSLLAEVTKKLREAKKDGAASEPAEAQGEAVVDYGDVPF